MTLAELLVASGLLTVVLVTVMTLFGQLLANTDKNSLLSAGAFFADSVLEQQIAQAQQAALLAPDNSVPAFALTVVEGEGRLSTTDDEHQTKFLYRVEVERIDPGLAAGPGQMWFVAVEVRWWANDISEADPGRAGYGNLSLKRGRMAYIPGPG